MRARSASRAGSVEIRFEICNDHQVCWSAPPTDNAHGSSSCGKLSSDVAVFPQAAVFVCLFHAVTTYSNADDLASSHGRPGCARRVSSYERIRVESAERQSTYHTSRARGQPSQPHNAFSPYLSARCDFCLRCAAAVARAPIFRSPWRVHSIAASNCHPAAYHTWL